MFIGTYSKIAFLSTPSARRATRGECQSLTYTPISIHALREEGDYRISAVTKRGIISIHALREEGDILWLSPLSLASDFYPRPPRGGRPIILGHITTSQKFLSTPSARRATYGRLGL